MRIGFNNVVPFTLIYVKDDDKVLLIKKAKGRSHEGQWIGLGGKVELGEDPISSAVRECREESGLIVEDPNLRGTLIWVSESILAIIHIVTATKYTGRLVESEEGALMWHPIEGLTKLGDLAEHQRWFVDRVLTDEEFFYSGVAVYQNDELIQHADSEALLSRRWDEEYQQGRYENAPPLPFVERIVTTLQEQCRTGKGRGLYIGCGNGRNFIPLIDAGLDLVGLDASSEALAQLGAKRPGLEASLIHADFSQFEPDNSFDYIIAIQVFQHGTASRVTLMMERVASQLDEGGLLFLRINSASTQVVRKHVVIESSDDGNFTIRYQESPKVGLPIHFLSHKGLMTTLDRWFEALIPPTETFTARKAPQTGHWAQWEGIWVKRSLQFR